MHRLEISLNQASRRSEIHIGRGLRHDLGQLISKSSELNPKRIALFSNKRVSSLYAKGIWQSLKRQGFELHPWLIPEGERYKSFSTLETLVDVLSDSRFERTDVVVALGGGVVGDVAGLAAAIYLRGVPFVQVPTTLLAQIDSSVGGKTGINLPVGKNLVGAFHQPTLVCIDPETLTSLPRRELVSGFCEMVKQSLVADRQLFEKTLVFLQRSGDSRAHKIDSELEALIASNCAFKASIVTNDERESTSRSDRRSRRILNFGHTTAHALEAVTKYKFFRHGEAVGYGMLVAGELSRNLGLLDSGDLEALREAVYLCGPRPRANHLDVEAIIRSLQHDKKSVRGQINWVLLEGVGLPKIVEGNLISKKVLRRSVQAGLAASGRQKEKFH